MKKIELNFHTLTPIWTGGVNKNSDQVCITGLMGSLRWWYEGIVRGMGGRACDPTEKSCEFNPKKSSSSQEQLCPACLLFGCTGWQRRFRIEVDNLRSIPLFFMASGGVCQASGNWLWRMFGGDQTGGKRQGRGQATQFTFGVQTLWGTEARLRIIPLKTDAMEIMAQLSFLLDFISTWGALGAKVQNGFGQINFPNLDKRLNNEGFKKTSSLAKRNIGENNKEHFSLGRFFSRIYELGRDNPYADSGRLIGDSGNFRYEDYFIPSAFDIRYKSQSRNPFTGLGKNFGMRPWFKQRFGPEKTNLLLGNSQAQTDEDRQGGRIGVSHLYRKESGGPFYLKVWGHVPDIETLGLEPKDVAGEIDSFLKDMFLNANLIAKYKQIKETTP